MAAKAKTELISLAFEIQDATQKAWLLSDGIRTAWLPKSQVVSIHHVSDSRFQLRFPYWLAKKKGII